MLRTKKGQSTLEYVIVLTAIIAAVLWIGSNVIKGGVDQSYEHVKSSIEGTATHIPDIK